MSFKIRLEKLMAYYQLIPKKLGDSLGYAKPDKLYRLLNDEHNNPSFHIVRDILTQFPNVNARWLVTGEGEMLSQRPTHEHGYCKECIRKEAVIDHQQKELLRRDKKIEDLIRDNTELKAKPDQAQNKSKAS